MWKELRQRVKKRIFPTNEEIQLGAFLEQLEPQVRNAILVLRKKGYCTYSSGFYGSETTGRSSIQAIDMRGCPNVSEETRQILKRLHIKIDALSFYGRKITRIWFKPPKADLEKIKAKWDRIALVLPNQGYQALFQEGEGSWEFRMKFLDLDILELMRLHLLLASRRVSRWRKRWKREARRLEKICEAKFGE